MIRLNYQIVTACSVMINHSIFENQIIKESDIKLCTLPLAKDLVLGYMVLIHESTLFSTFL